MAFPSDSPYERLWNGKYGTKVVRHRDTDDLGRCRSFLATIALPTAALDSFTEYKNVTAFNLASYIDVFTSPSHLFLVSEDLGDDSVDLSELIPRWRNRSPSEIHVLYIFVQVAFGVASLHAAGLVHGTLQLQNVFLKQNGCVKICDFGLREIAGKVQKFRDRFARVPAPEEGGQVFDPKSDIWALGVILHQLCVGRNPEVGKVRYLTKFSADLNALIARLLDPQPEKRPTAEGIIASPFIRSYLNWLLEVKLALRIPKLAKANVRWVAVAPRRGSVAAKGRPFQEWRREPPLATTRTIAPLVREPWLQAGITSPASPVKKKRNRTTVPVRPVETGAGWRRDIPPGEWAAGEETGDLEEKGDFLAEVKRWVGSAREDAPAEGNEPEPQELHEEEEEEQVAPPANAQPEEEETAE
jgi:hypothetical protein